MKGLEDLEHGTQDIQEGRGTKWFFPPLLLLYNSVILFAFDWLKDEAFCLQISLGY